MWCHEAFDNETQASPFIRRFACLCGLRYTGSWSALN